MCARCAFLDGERPADAAVIGALRMQTPLSVTEIKPLIGMSVETIHRSLARLKLSGRVKRLGALCMSGGDKDWNPRYVFWELIEGKERR